MRTLFHSSLLASLLATATLAACSSDDEITKSAIANITPTMAGAAGPTGTARFQQKGTTTTLTVDLAGLTPGMHGFHIHAGTSCDPDMAGVAAGAAMGHWNPTSASHGASPQMGHAGDLGNIEAGADGKATKTFTNTKWTIATNDPTTDVMGHAVVVHAMPDDLMTNPAGNSGGRIGCGLVK